MSESLSLAHTRESLCLSHTQRESESLCLSHTHTLSLTPVPSTSLPLAVSLSRVWCEGQDKEVQDKEVQDKEEREGQDKEEDEGLNT